VGQTVRFQEILRRLAMIDEGFVEDQARLGLDPAQASALDPKTAALLHVAACVAIGSPAVCLQWSTGRALATARVRRRSPACARSRLGPESPRPPARQLPVDSSLGRLAGRSARGWPALRRCWLGLWHVNRHACSKPYRIVRRPRPLSAART
jgi:hypothetical protein